MLKESNKEIVQDLIFKLFMADLDKKEAKQIIEILKYKKLYPIPEKDNEMKFCTFLENFWDWEKSSYIKERLLHNHGIHRQYVFRCASAIKRYWLPWFCSELLLKDVTRNDLKDFVLSFSERASPVTAQGKNDIIRSGTVALKWAYKNGLIESDITSGLVYYSGNITEIEILEPEIVKKLFNNPWKNKKAEMANKLAMLTGLRSGEIQALRGCDIADDCIYVRHSWNKLDGLKVPKNGETRIAYVPFPDILKKLKKMAIYSDCYVFSGRNPLKPMDAKCWLRELRQELKKLGVDEDIIEKIHFHSWRHYFTVHMKNQGNLEPYLLGRMTGHKTSSMLEYYGNHKLNVESIKMKEAVQRVFANFL